jgi:hypothetical protein
LSLANPKQNLALPIAVQRRVDAMFAGTSVGLSGPEMLEYFSRFDADVEQYPWSGGAPSRKQILQDCLARFTKEQQLDILVDMLRPENFQKYSPPPGEDQRFLLEWVVSQKQGSPPPPATRPIPTMTPASTWDVFVSHASEDKETFAKPLAHALQERGVKVWFDAFTLTVGDSLRRSIDRGLAQSRFGIVVLSEAFFQKHWPQLELDGLVARESAGVKVILPIWHDIDESRVRIHSPMLADRVAVSSARGLDHVVEQLLHVIEPGRQRGTAA